MSEPHVFSTAGRKVTPGDSVAACSPEERHRSTVLACIADEEGVDILVRMYREYDAAQKMLRGAGIGHQGQPLLAGIEELLEASP